MADILKWARDRKKNVESIANKAQGVYHQANMWDDGRTYDTNQRGVTPGTANPVNIKSDDTPGFQWSNNSLTRGLSRGYDQANIFDNGKSWKQRTANTNNSVISQAAPIGKALIKAPVQMLNTAGAQLAEIPATVEGYVLTREQSDITKKMLEAQKKGDRAAYEAFKAKSDELSGRIEDVFRMQEAGHDQFNQESGGLFNMGTFYGAEDSRRGDLKTGVTKIGGGTLQTMATVAPFAKGGSVATLVGGKALLPKTAILAAEGAGYGAAYSAGSQLQNEGQIDPKTLAKDTIIGAGTAAALPLVGAGVRAGASKVAPNATKVVAGAVNRVDDTVLKTKAGVKPITAVQDVVKNDKVYQQLDKRVYTAIENASTSTGALKKNYRQEAVELIRQRNARVRELAPDQGGYINPGAMADDAKNAANKIKNKVTGKVDEAATPESKGLSQVNKSEISKEAEANTIVEFINSPFSTPKEVKKAMSRLKELSGNEDGFVKVPGKGPEKVPTTRAYGKTIEMTEQNGYKAIKTKDGGVIYNKTQTEGSNIKGTRGPVDRYYTADGTKINRAQADAYVDGRLSTRTATTTRKDTRQLIPAVQNKQPGRAVTPKTEPVVKNTRFASKTVQGSPEVSQAVKKGVKEADNSYTLVHNKDQIARSEKFIKKNNIRNATADVKERLSAKDFDDQVVSDAIAVAKKLDARGGKADLVESTAIYNQLSEKLTKAGQTVQAARLLNNRTPEGMKHWALSQLKKEGVQLSPDKAKKLEELIGTVRKAKPDTYDAGLSRYRVAEFVARNTPAAASSKAIQIWKAGLLSSPRTTAGNLFANTAETIFKKGWVDPVSTATDKLMSVFTGQRSRSYTLRGMPTGAKEGIVKGVKYFKTGYDPRNPDVKWDIRNIHFSDKPAGKAAEAYTQTVFRLMGAQDQPFYYANMRNSLYDQAITAAKNEGLKGTQRQAFIRKFVTEPAKDALELADKEGRYAVFQNETALGKAASRLKSMDGPAGDVAEFIMPFSGVPSSIATRIIERTPIGTATEIVKQIKRGKFDQRAMTKAIANGSAVVPLVGAGYALAEADMITLGYPKDKNERELWEAEGKQPYSIKQGDKWLSMNYFQPGGTIIAAGAEYKAALDRGESQADALKVATAGAGKAFTEQSFLKGVSSGLNAITDPVYAGEKFVDQTAGSVVPNFIRSGATASDTVKREARTVPDQIKRGIPGLRQTLDVKKDLFGRDVKENTTAPNVLLNPLRPSNVRNADDPTTNEIRRLTDADEGITPTQIKKDAFMKDGKGTKLTDKEVDDFNAEVGKNVKVEWDKVMSDPKYNDLADDEKRKILDRVNSDVYGALKRKYEADKGIGEYSQDFDGKSTKLSTNEKRYLEGKAVDYYSKDSSERTPVEEYEYQKQKFDEEKDSYNEIERAQKETEIKRLGIKKDYDEVTTDLYDLNKGDAYDYVASKGKDGEAAFMKAVEYGDKLVAAGIIDKNKWRDKYGNIDLESGSKSSKKGGKKGKKPWQAPNSSAIKLASNDNRQLITSVSGKIKARRTRRKFA